MRFSSLVVNILIPFVGAVPSWRMNYNINVSQIDLYYKRERENLSKVVLIMDMPESCFGCNFCHINSDGEDSCQALEVARPFDSETYEKPAWCPLRVLPERKETNYYMNNKEKGIVEGWNACLDEIMK